MLVALVLLVGVCRAEAQAVSAQGVTYMLDGGSMTVDVTGVDTGSPVVLGVGSGWGISAPALDGTFALNGLPTGDPAAAGIVNFQTSGLSTLSLAADASGIGAGAITLETAGSFTATGVTGGPDAAGGIFARSFGASGNPVNGLFEPESTAGDQPFDGTDGGGVTFELLSSGTVNVTGTVAQGDPATSWLVGVAASSVGGAGTYGYYAQSGLDDDPAPFYGNGGAGGAVTVTTDGGASIEVTGSGVAGGASGILALSQGGAAGAFYGMSGGEIVNYVGAGGAGGAVMVTHGGVIGVTAPFGAGISAQSIGGDGNVSALVTNEGGGVPGNGGAVTVELRSGGSVDVTDGGIGVFALSQAGLWVPAGSSHLPTGGAVSVSLDAGAAIATGGVSGSAAPFSFGVLALSAGNPLVTETNYGDLASSGTAAAVALDNAGTITTNGELAVGLAGLGVGGAPVVASLDGGASAVGTSGSTSGGGGGGVSITNSGTITTLGASSDGIVALSAGSGGIVANDAPAVTEGSGNAARWTSGTALGADTGSGDPGLTAEAVSVTNSGTITTGDGGGGGVAALGILAQSVGGGGGTVGGSSSLTNAGDAGGGGGAGGGATVTLDAGSAIETRDKNAVAVLAQSIGGGGGNAANAAGGFVATGGTGGAGGAGGTAKITISDAGSVATLSNYAAGLVAQSVGGGGGNGGYADTAGAFVSVAIGGTGGGGGAGGSASVANDGGSTVTTFGNNSDAALVQSIGGGGGRGGAATSYSAGILFDVSTALGGTGGSGGAGGGASGTNAGDIVTGLAPDSLANASLVAGTGLLYGTLTDGRTIDGAGLETGSLADAVLSGTLTSIALSDGSVIENATVSGATISGTSNDAPVTLTLQAGGLYHAVAENAASDVVNGLLILDGTLDTDVGGPNPNGANSSGLVVQSIGGGGGSGGAASAKSLVLPLPGAKQAGVNLPTISFTTALGGLGGAGNGGGTVTAGNTGSILTYGDASFGVLAQSIGGGGGVAGDATAASTAIQSSGIDFQLTTGNGGTGGAGATGGSVTVTNSADGAITTHGQNAVAILAQSIGGGGGAGGVGNAGGSTPPMHYSTGKSFAPSIGVGGVGGSGGAGGSVSVTNASGSAIATFGSTAQGILAQSVGGGGGTGGGGTASGTGDTLNLDVAVGGTGAGGGAGGAVVAENDGTIATAGGDSTGMLGQSIGGGGGVGGTSDAFASASASVLATLNNSAGVIQNVLTGTPFYTATLTVGGAGGGGGNGGAVTLTNTFGNIPVPGSYHVEDWTAGIATTGSRAFGMLGQSIGGGGGVGGTATGDSRSALVTKIIDGSGITTPRATVNLASANGQAGYGGTVGVANTGVVVTRGYGAHGLVAQGIGGGGGYGADGSVDSDITLSLGAQITGGFGAAGGNPNATSATVNVSTGAEAGVMTTGRAAAGIVAQSIGGGGGVASSGTDAFATIGGRQAGTATYALDLGGGAAVTFSPSGVPIDPGPNMGTGVSVSHDGQIVTKGDWSGGIVAQSIGSGGGIASAYATDSVDAEVSMTVGSTSDAYGVGGAVTVDLGAGSAITTGAAMIAADGSASRAGYSAFGILAQSIGDGGGLAIDDSAYAVSPCSGSTCRAMTVGGWGTDNGGAVSLAGGGTITTHGDGAHGAALQSIGGGGGVGGQGRTLAEGIAPGQALSVQLGNLASPSSGDGGTVSISNATLDVTTEGDNAFGLLAQSVGGGGGLVFAQSAGSATIGVQQPSGSYLSSAGGDVTINLKAGSAITTTGTGSIGILAQSIGYSGGVAGYLSGDSGASTGINDDFSYVMHGASGDGGTVSVNVDAEITTSGALAHGIFAQSLGSGGGIMNAGSTQTIERVIGGGWEASTEVTQSGSVIATGANASAIFAQSNGGANAIVVQANGSVQGGSGAQGSGIWIDGGAQGSGANQIQITAGGWVSALSGNAISFTVGTGSILNHGAVAGSVGDNYFWNYGTYYTNGTDQGANLPQLFFDFGTVGLSPSYRGGPTELTSPLMGGVPVVYQVDTGTVFSILTANSYGGGTTLAGGVVAVNNDGAFGGGGIRVINPTAEIRATTGDAVVLANEIALDRNLILSTSDTASSLTIGGKISGTGGIATGGPGDVVLTANNSYSGPTTVGGGTLTAGGAGALPFTPLTVAAGATVDTNRFDYSFPTLSGSGTVTSISNAPSLTLGESLATYRFDGVIDAGIGAVSFVGGTAVLTGANAYTGGTSLIGGPTAVVLGNDRALSNGAVTVNASYAFFYTTGPAPITLANDIALVQPISLSTDAEGEAPLALSGAITGQSALYKLGTGDVTLAGNSQYVGNTYVQAGRLLAGSTTGLDAQSAFIVAPGATLDLNGYDSEIGSLSGGGTVTNSATGTATLTVGTDGKTTSFDGTISGSGSGDNTAAAASAFRATAAPSRAGEAHRDLSLVKTGSGALYLMGANSFSGGATIARGALGVGDPAALGTGDVTNGGLLFAAGDNRRIEIGGDYTQRPEGRLILAIDAEAVRTDRLRIEGAALFSGDLGLAFGGPIAPGAGLSLTPFTAGAGFTGSFDRVESSFPTIIASAREGEILLRQGSFAAADAPYTANAAAVAAYVDAYAGGPMTPDFAGAVGALNALSPDAAALAAGFDRLHPAPLSAFALNTVTNDASFHARRFDAYAQARRSREGFGTGDALAATAGLAPDDSGLALAALGGASVPGAGDPSPWHVYAQGGVILGASGMAAEGFDDDGATTSYFEIGGDYRLGPNLLIGGFLRQSRASAAIDPHGGGADLESYEPGIYAAFARGGWYANALASYGFDDFDQTRAVAVNAANELARSAPGSDHQVANLDGGYDHRSGGWTWGPNLGALYTRLRVDGFTEEGAPGLGLTVDEQMMVSLRGRAGAHVRYDWTRADTRFQAHLNADWQHEFLDDGATVAARFASVGEGAFLAETPDAPRNTAAFDLGLAATITGRLSGFVGYAAMAGEGDYFAQAFQSGLCLSF